MPLTNRPDTPKSIRKNNSIKHTHTHTNITTNTRRTITLWLTLSHVHCFRTPKTHSADNDTHEYTMAVTLSLVHVACRPPSAQTTKHSLTHHHETKLVGWLVLYVHLKKLLLLAFNRIENNLLND